MDARVVHICCKSDLTMICSCVRCAKVCKLCLRRLVLKWNMREHHHSINNMLAGITYQD